MNTDYWNEMLGLKEAIGTECLLDSIIRAMSTDDRKAYVEYIARMYDIDKEELIDNEEE